MKYYSKRHDIELGQFNIEMRKIFCVVFEKSETVFHDILISYTY